MMDEIRRSGTYAGPSVWDESGTERDLLERVCRAYRSRLVGALSLYTGNVGLAEEFAQEALFRLCRDWRRIRDKGAVEAWLYSTAFNLARSWFRRKRIENRLSEDDSRSDEKTSSSVADIDDSMDLRWAVAELPGRQKAAVILRYYVDLSYAEIALHLGCEETTARSLVFRALNQLRSTDLVPEGEDDV